MRTIKEEREIIWQDKEKGLYDENYRKRNYFMGIKIKDFQVTVRHQKIEEAPVAKKQMGFQTQQ